MNSSVASVMIFWRRVTFGAIVLPSESDAVRSKAISRLLEMATRWV